MSGVRLGGRESDLTIPECGLAIMIDPNFGGLDGFDIGSPGFVSRCYHTEAQILLSRCGSDRRAVRDVVVPGSHVSSGRYRL